MQCYKKKKKRIAGTTYITGQNNYNVKKNYVHTTCDLCQELADLNNITHRRICRDNK